MSDVWVANVRVLRSSTLGISRWRAWNYDGTVSVRLDGADGADVTVVAHRAHPEERRSDDFTAS